MACLPPGGWWGVGCAIGCRSEKKRMRLVRKTSFCFFLLKKNHKKKGQKRDILRPKQRLFNTEHQSATHHEPKYHHHRAETGTDDDVPKILSKTPSVAKGEEMAREAVARRLAKVRFVSPFFCDSSSARIEEDDRRCRASDRRGTFLKCHAKMCSVINQSVPPNESKRRDGCKRLTYATRVFFGLLNLLLRAGHERSGRVRLRFFHR